MQIDKEDSQHVEKSLKWTLELQSQLFNLHDQFGNKWSIISVKMNNISQNCIKNKFYSTLRKGFRKINKYLANIRRKIQSPNLSCNKLIKPDFLVKLNAVVDQHYIQKYEVKQIALTLSLKIQKDLIKLAKKDIQYQLKGNEIAQFLFEDQLLKNIQQFNRNCKKRKGKRKQNKLKDQPIQEQQSQKLQLQQQVHEQSYGKKAQQNNKKNVSQIVQILDNIYQDADNLYKIVSQNKENMNKIQNIDEINKPSTQMNQSNMFEILLDHNSSNLAFKKDISQQKSFSNSNYLIDPVPIGSGCFQFYHQKVKYQINNDLKVSVSSFNETDQHNIADNAQNNRLLQLSLNRILQNDSISIFSSNSIRKSLDQSSQIPKKAINLSQSQPLPFSITNATSYSGKLAELELWAQKLLIMQNSQIFNRTKQQKKQAPV